MENLIEEKNCYVYFHINPVKNKIFYVGKGGGGKGNRYDSKNDRNQHWENTVKKYGYYVDIVEDGLTEKESFEREKFYIKKIGRKNLTNMTDGGEGISGLIHSEETKQKMRDAKTDDVRKRMSEFKKNYIVTEETKNKIREYNTGKKLSEEHKKKISESGKGRVFSEEHKQKMSESLKGKIKSEEYKLKMIESKIKNSKGIEIDGITYLSIRGASRILLKNKEYIKYRLNSDKFPNYKYL